MTISEFIKSFRGCQHKRVRITSKGAYCPDCGKFIVVKWYIVRCSCCGIKRAAYLDFNDNVKAVDRYCPNCGSIHTYVEELEKIDFMDINFAVHKKEEIETVRTNFASTQVWTEPNDKKEQLLIGFKQRC